MVDHEPIGNDVKRFILEQIDSFEHLEILLLLHAHQDRDWSLAEICQKLRNSETSASQRLVDLRNTGLVTTVENSEIRFRYSPADSELKKTVDALVKAYFERRVSILNLLFSKKMQRIQVFSDAFNFRKDDKDG